MYLYNTFDENMIYSQFFLSSVDLVLLVKTCFKFFFITAVITLIVHVWTSLTCFDKVTTKYNQMHSVSTTEKQLERL